MSEVRLLRRSFLQAIGVAAGGLALGFETEAAAAPGDGLRPNVFVHIAASGLVTIACARSEMGQGVRSSLPVLIADELGATMDKVQIIQADGDKAYGNQNTDGSHSVRGQYDGLRQTGAAARMMLIAAAAKRWKVPAASLTAQDNVVTHAATKRSLGFGELADEAGKLPVPNKADIVLRKSSELKNVGKELPLLDGPDLVTGRAKFGADVVLPGMLVAVIARPPVAGGSVSRFDSKSALAVPGVKQVIKLPVPKRPFGFQPLGGLAVVADNTWAALRGRKALDIAWDHGSNAKYDSPAYREHLLASLRGEGMTFRNRGDVDTALAKAKKKVDAIYYAPHLAHAPMEPPACIAKVDGDKCEVWAATQNPQDARTEVAKALGVDEANVKVHVTFLGGGFGRKSKPDYIVEAALVSRAVKAPVRVQWTREDDVQHDYYHSVSAQHLIAGLDEDDHVIAWEHRTAFPPIASIFSGANRASAGDLQQGVLDLPLVVPNVRAIACQADALTRIGWLRSVYNIFHAFAVQSFVDEIAHARQLDPLDMQRKLLGQPRIVDLKELGIEKLSNYGQSLEEHPINTERHWHVLDRVTKAARWSDRKNRALGLAVHRSFLTYVAVVVSVVKRAERIEVDEVWVCADAGIIVNLERVKSQLEGAMIFGLSQALYGEITMKSGATEQSNFRDYRLMRMNRAPRAINVDVITSDHPPGGVGEPGVPPVAPALANAIFALTGKRVRELPIAKTFSV